MIDAAIVGLGRWGRVLVTAVQGKSDRLRFTRGVSRNLEAHRDFAATHRIGLVADLDAVLADRSIDAVALATPHSLHCQHVNFPPVDSVQANLEAFADAVAGGAPYPIPTSEMLDTVTAFEAIAETAKLAL